MLKQIPNRHVMHVSLSIKFQAVFDQYYAVEIMQLEEVETDGVFYTLTVRELTRNVLLEDADLEPEEFVSGEKLVDLLFHTTDSEDDWKKHLKILVPIVIEKLAELE